MATSEVRNRIRMVLEETRDRNAADKLTGVRCGLISRYTLIDEKYRGLLIMSWVGEKVHGST